ncbi:hypothetical protein T484DRAFT_1758392, partial [Baffinella frigidus]
MKECGFNFEILIKKFDEPLILPDNWKKNLSKKEFNIINDADAGEKFTECFKDDLKKCNGVNYFKINDIWKSGRECDEGIINTLSKIKFMTWDETGNKWVWFNKTLKSNEDIRKYVKSSNDYVDEKFEDNIFSNNLHKICFRDKYFDFEKYDGKNISSGLFMYDNNVTCRYKLSYDFPERIEEDVIEFNNKIFVAAMPDKIQRETYLQYQVRGVAGHIEDKQWATAIGERNSCKGVYSLSFRVVLEKYFSTIGANTFLQSKNMGGDEAKKLSYLNGSQFAKLTFTDEIDSKTGNKLDGNKIKSFASGGDVIQMRQNFENERDLTIGCRLTMNLNCMPYVEPRDALENVVVFNMRKKFVDVIPEVNVNNIYQKADPNIKYYIRTEKARNAFLHLLISHYIPNKIILDGMVKEDTEMKQEMDDKEDDMTIIMKHFEITNNKMDKITRKHILEYQNLRRDWRFINEDVKYISPKDIQDKLIRLGAAYKK